jgi:hypothetical protein
MPKKRKPKKRKYNKLNYDPEKYDWVNSKEGGYPRRKKGTVKPVRLNNVLQFNAAATRSTNEAAKRVLAKLYPFLQYLMLGRTVVKIAGAFKKSLAQSERMDYSFLQGLDFQPEYTLQDIVNELLRIVEKDGVLFVDFPAGAGFVKKHSSLPTGYFVELILLHGDPASENGLRVDSVESRLFSFEEEGYVECKLSILLPEKEPWMVLVKVSCLMGRGMANTGKYYALKVIRVGKGISNLD